MKITKRLSMICQTIYWCILKSLAASDADKQMVVYCNNRAGKNNKPKQFVDKL